MRSLRLLLLLLLTFALSPDLGAAAEIKDRTWMFGVGLGAGTNYGGAKAGLGNPLMASGSVLYAGEGERSWAFEVDRIFFQPKAGNKADATALTLVGRSHISANYREAVLYALLGLGYSEIQADLGARGHDRGSGAALSLGAGLFMIKDSPISWGGEVRLMRLGAPVARLGLGGVTFLALNLRATFRLEPTSDPFSP